MSPARSLRPCMAPGCAALHRERGGRCAVHARENEQARQKYLNTQRPPDTAQHYDGEWRKTRAAFLAENPACVWCGGKAQEVDHVNAVRENPSIRLAWSNLRATCTSCHSRRTATEQGFARRGRAGKP
jgi:5-methylcytosine-specific restriction protein A